MSNAEVMDGLVEDWFKIFRTPHDLHATSFLERCQAHTIEANGNSYTYYESGSGPTVLLVHGIHSNLGSMVAIAKTLVSQNYRVVLFDVPAHGEAVGSATDPIEVREFIRALYGKIDDLYAIVGHSLGGLWSLAAWDEKIPAKTFVAISSPSNMWFLVEKFVEMRRVDSDLVPELARRLEARLGEGVWTECSPSEIVGDISIPGLIIHGANDDFVLPQHAHDLHGSWRQSTMEIIEDAGHLDILGSPKVREIISTHLREL